MTSKVIAAPIPEYDGHYGFDAKRHSYRYVTAIHRDGLFMDLFDKLAKQTILV